MLLLQLQIDRMTLSFIEKYCSAYKDYQIRYLHDTLKSACEKRVYWSNEMIRLRKLSTSCLILGLILVVAPVNALDQLSEVVQEISYDT